MESINQKIKLILGRYSNIVKFFDDLKIVISVRSSELDMKSVRSYMRVKRIDEKNPTLLKYKEFLTDYAYRKLHHEYEKQIDVKFQNIDADSAIISVRNGYIITTNPNNCTCTFFCSMGLPCRHLFSFFSYNESDLFNNELCLTRWTRIYYGNNKPTFNSNLNYQPQIVSAVQIHQKDEINKYKEISKIIKSIPEKMSTLQNDLYLHYLKLN